jgi:RNA-binding protein
MTLTKSQIRHLRSLAHHLKPVLIVGVKGITENILVELNRALEDHELIKISIAGANKDERQIMTHELCQASRAQLVQIIGRISILYKPNKKPRLLKNEISAKKTNKKPRRVKKEIKPKRK